MKEGIRSGVAKISRLLLLSLGSPRWSDMHELPLSRHPSSPNRLRENGSDSVGFAVIKSSRGSSGCSAITCIVSSNQVKVRSNLA